MTTVERCEACGKATRVHRSHTLNEEGSNGPEVLQEALKTPLPDVEFCDCVKSA